MGTSNRRRNSKVKEILQSYGIADDLSNLPNAIPQIFAVAITKQMIEKEFSGSSFSNCVTGGIAGIGAIASGNFNSLGLGKDFEFDKDNPKTINQIKFAILNSIDFEENDMMKNALNKVLTKFIMEDIQDSVNFLKEFCSNIFEALLHSVTVEELIEEVNENISKTDLDKNVKFYSDQLIEEYYSKLIEDYVNSKTSLDELFVEFFKINEKVKEKMKASKEKPVEGAF